MPPRDEQEWESRRQQIINGALRVFATLGFEKATNKDIARAAGIGSPGLIYHYFKDKRDLLEQVFEHRTPLLHLFARGEDIMARPPREALSIIVEAFLETLNNEYTAPLFKLMLSEATRRPAVAEIVNSIGPGRALGFLQHYLEHQMELGTLRRTDPVAAARCLAGPLIAYVLTREVFHQPDALKLPARVMAETTIDIFLNGMLPDAPSTEIDGTPS